MTMTPRLQMASILLLTFFVFSCYRPGDGMKQGPKAVITLMDSAECIMDDNPAYADSLMRSINPHSILTKRQRARYALLYTATEYKNDQLFTSDSLIMEAVRYYSIRNNIDYRFLSYYYLGCVYLEMNQLTDAFVAYSQAEVLVDRINNELWKGLLYARLGEIYYQTCIMGRASEYYSQSCNCFEIAEKNLHKYYAMYWLAECELNSENYHKADSLAQLIQDWAYHNKKYRLYQDAINIRFIAAFNTNDINGISVIYDKYLSPKGNDNIIQCDTLVLALYYLKTKDLSKAEFYLERGRRAFKSPEEDSVYYNFYKYLIANEKGDIEGTIKYLRSYTSHDDGYVRKVLNSSILGAHKDYYKKVAELESAKTHIRKTRLIASIILFCLLISIGFYVSLKRRRDTEKQIQDYISTINDLTTQISVNKDKISNLNAKVREMIRNQFNPSDYLYTRYYEQIDDSRKAEHLYRVVRSQLKEFTNTKNLQHIDELLDDAFDGIMSKLLSSGLEFKEKDLLLIRFALAGFSAKSIAALLDESHQNINQRKKRMLDKIQIQAPKLMDELRIALNIKQINASPTINA